ncbi:response regulator transcription factor [Clostridiales bacterium FE2011]|nr:response regulator transcription factor [Clostridiales bacterium FE2011]QTE75646.1 response regulator transcription factor [Clostridiales bacterium FE2010]
MNIAICDDNPEDRSQLRDMLTPYNAKEKLNIKEFSSGEELIMSNEEKFIWDIVFLDIEMEGITGIETGKKLRKLRRDVIVIFVTSHINYVSDAFRQNAFQFLVKPVQDKEFRKDFERALRLWRNRHKQYVIKSGDKTYVIKYSDILYLEAYHRHIKVHTEKTDYECIGKLNDEYQKLKPYGFVQCHQGYIVNMGLISGFSKTEVTMSDGSEVPISRRLYTVMMREFNMYIAGKMV